MKQHERRGEKLLNVFCDPKLLLALKLHAISEGRTIKSIVNGLITEYLKSKGVELS